MNHNYLSTRHSHVQLKHCLAFAAIAVFSCACSTTLSKNNMDGDQKTPNATATSSDIAMNKDRVITPASNEDASPDGDFIADWAKERAEYLRSLDYQKIDDQQNTPANNSIKSNLVNTRFYLDYAERLLYVDGDIQGAKNEINHAVQAYKKALDTAGNKETGEMLMVKSELRSLAENTQRVQPSYCDYPPRPHFNRVENEIEDLLTKL